jgi:hypothetical protein
MDQALLNKASAKTAAEVCARYKPSTSATKVLQDGLTPRQFVELLRDSRLYVDAFDFLAHALPRREAIWWACLGVRHCLGPALPPKQSAALKAAVEWVLEPDEPKRRAAQAAGESASFSTPAGLVAFAVFGSGGSLGPANFPAVPPTAYMTSEAVSASLAMASVQGDPQAVSDVQRDLVELGIAIAEGKCTWPAATKIAAQSTGVGSAPGQRF